MGSDKRYGVYGVAYRMWRGTVNWEQRPRFASDNLDEARRYFENEVKGSTNGNGCILVDYNFKKVITCKYKENGTIHTL